MKAGRGKKVLKCIMFFMIVAMMTGCGKLKTEEKAIQWAKKTYDIDATILEKIKVEEALQYIMKSDEGVVFELNSEMKPWGLDGSIFGETEYTSSNYYAKLIEFYTEDINDIEKKYKVRFIAGKKGIITAIYKEHPNLAHPEKDLVELSDAVEELADLLHPKKAYDFNHGNRIFMTDNINTLEHGEYSFEFNEREAGKLVDQRNTYYRQNNLTYSQIKEDAISWAGSIHKDYYGFKFSFYLPKEIALIEAYSEKEVLNETYYIDVKKYNKLYEKLDGNITPEDFAKCVMEYQL